MKIFRVETESGQGPFYMLGAVEKADHDAYYWATQKFFDTNGIHKVPCDSMVFKRDLIFGCRSIEDLRQWFDNRMLDILRKYGYRINEYNAKTVRKHCDPSVTNQIAFKRCNAKLIATYPLFSND